MESASLETKGPITLSPITKALVDTLKPLKPRTIPNDLSKLNVSQTVSFFAIAYERIRNAIEYREDHLIRRAAIERIMRRRLMLNTDGKGEAENLLRELMWARYFQNGSLGEDDVMIVQKIIDRYMNVRRIVLTGRDGVNKKQLSNFLFDLLTCELEETLSPVRSTVFSSFTYFIYQTLRNKILIDKISPDQKDAFFLVAVERAYRKSDIATLHYHIFTSFYQPISQYTEDEIKDLSANLPAIVQKIEDIISNPYVDSLARFIRKQLPPFNILLEIFQKKPKEIETIITDKTKLWNEIDLMCREKYQWTASRIRNLAIRSLIYIFVTKMIFALILEYPISMLIYGEVHPTSIIINGVFPPILMLIIVSIFRLPGEDNTQKIFQRIIDIIDIDKAFENNIAYTMRKTAAKKPLLVFGFTVFYSFTFVITLLFIYQILTLLEFNLVSQVIFIFFVSVVTFFSYRVRQVTNEYRLIEKESAFTPVVDFFFMPILSLGKFFSSELAKLNFFIIIFDFIIEAPFKLIIEVVEDWISFVRSRKEEIV